MSSHRFYLWICLFLRVEHPTPVLLPGKSHGWRSLVGCSPWGHKELDMTEQVNWTELMVWRRQWHPTPVLLPGKSHGWRSLVGCSPWGCEASYMTERLHFHFSLSCIGEGNGNPLQCFCLENTRDGGAWWAAVYGVAQSRTRLKRLSSHSSKSRTQLKQPEGLQKVSGKFSSKEYAWISEYTGDVSLIPGSGRSSGGGHGNPF